MGAPCEFVRVLSHSLTTFASEFYVFELKTLALYMASVAFVNGIYAGDIDEFWTFLFFFSRRGCYVGTIRV
jgi:hypothetical protein